MRAGISASVGQGVAYASNKVTGSERLRDDVVNAAASGVLLIVAVDAGGDHYDVRLHQGGVGPDF